MAKRKQGALLASEVTILGILSADATYGYALSQALNIPHRTAHDTLARLETMGFARASWDTGNRQPRRVYSITPAGRKALHAAAPRES